MRVCVLGITFLCSSWIQSITEVIKQKTFEQNSQHMSHLYLNLFPFNQSYYMYVKYSVSVVRCDLLCIYVHKKPNELLTLEYTQKPGHQHIVCKCVCVFVHEMHRLLLAHLNKIGNTMAFEMIQMYVQNITTSG